MKNESFDCIGFEGSEIIISGEKLIGGNQATAAVDEGLRGMRVGEIRELIAPAYLVKRKGYPANVSPDSTLVIKMKLAKIERQ